MCRTFLTSLQECVTRFHLNVVIASLLFLTSAYRNSENRNLLSNQRKFRNHYLIKTNFKEVNFQL